MSSGTVNVASSNQVSGGIDGSADVHEVDDEDQRLSGGDGAAGAAVAVAQVGRDGELAPTADLHAGDALVPALDHSAGAEGEVERSTAVPRRVELLPGRERPARVVGAHRAAGRRLVA